MPRSGSVLPYFVGLLIAPSFFLLPDRMAVGVEKKVADDSAQVLVQEALHREIYGLDKERDNLLGRAVDLEPAYAPARWHQGMVKYRGQWMMVDDVAQFAPRDHKLTSYNDARSRQPDNLEGNLRMANWCRQQQLTDQERAHLLRVLDLSPDNAEVRARLGFRQLEGEWIDEETARGAQERQRAIQLALRKWTPRMEQLRDQLADRSLKERQVAAKAIRTIDDPTAIPALEAVLVRHNREAAGLVVESLQGMRDQEAVNLLATMAVTSEWAEVRSAAARELGERPQEGYVPQMLDAMYTPVVTRTEVVPVQTGGLMYRHQFEREGKDERQVLLLDTEYRRIALPGGNRRETQARAWFDSVATAVSRELSVTEQNAATELLNTRISDALVTATGQQLPPVPQKWWDWWNQQNSVAMQGSKQTRTTQRVAQFAVPDQGDLSDSGGSSQGGRSVLPQRVECFAAGAPVCTAAGMVAIEKLRVGDMVLAQNIETGELAFKPITRTTVRPEEPLVEFRVDRDSFRTTEGHLMWVSGQGWVKAKQLRSGMQAHTLTGGTAIDRSDSEVGKAETYNLSVADFHTYFVGECRVLSHDVTDQLPTLKVVPGLNDR
jgi:hypothetical protein